MKVLFICSGNFDGKFEHAQAFVYDQYNSVLKRGIDVNLFLIQGKGIIGYMKSLFPFWKIIRENKYSLIHAFYGFSGLFACLQFSIPVLTTFLGSDVNDKKARKLSKIAYLFSEYSIFVDLKIAKILKASKRFDVLKFGVDLENFFSIDKSIARKKLGFSSTEKIILFSSFKRKEKNFALAKEAIKILKKNIRIIELGKDYSKSELNYLYNSCDLFLMTSLNEGSPQVIKEAMACNLPIVSVDVGDVKEIIGDTEGCFISTFNPYDVTQKIKMALEFKRRTTGREKIMHLDNKIIASKVYEVYSKVLNGN